MAQSLSKRGAAFVGRHEGTALQLYNDPAGHCTVGIGHLVHHGRCDGRTSEIPFKNGITKERAFALLQQDAAIAERSINSHVKVPLTQAQFDALVSFAYNVGVGAFEGSTLLRKLNAGQKSAVPNELDKWVNAGGRRLPGLVARRKDEGRLFSKGDYGDGQPADAGGSSNVDPLTPGERKLVKRLEALRAKADKANGWDKIPEEEWDEAEAIKKWIRYERMRDIRVEAGKSKGGWDRSRRRARYDLLKKAYGSWPKEAEAETVTHSDVPSWVPNKFHHYWKEPWGKAAKSAEFRRLLEKHGYLSPNFKKSEARCKCGTPVPKSLNTAARDQAFALERLRHRLGDRSIPIISWYRPGWYNDKVGGARNSQHINAVAVDVAKQTIDHLGRAKVLKAGNIVFANDGMGVYPGGSMHFDNRGYKARWDSWSRSVRQIGLALGVTEPSPTVIPQEEPEDDPTTTTLGLPVDALYEPEPTE